MYSDTTLEGARQQSEPFGISARREIRVKVQIHPTPDGERYDCETRAPVCRDEHSQLEETNGESWSEGILVILCSRV